MGNQRSDLAVDKTINYKLRDMKKAEIQQRIIAIVADLTMEDDFDVEQNLDKVIKNEWQFDSLDEVDLVMRLEAEFKISIPDEVAEKFKTTQDHIDYIWSQMHVI